MGEYPISAYIWGKLDFGGKQLVRNTSNKLPVKMPLISQKTKTLKTSKFYFTGTVKQQDDLPTVPSI